uniref:Ysc84 actin-binding domain-containing protein n=1 Tax=Entomoneis paludosa TaxID=265537 RepID=A0A7S2YL23_9STRA|mmetsp:Transcript_3717/g.7826  ORF Transcript_3717/g.7826 Transcript_3717/m.7826 type:complete len:232 (+) Transcript_3717:219-914(+)|eukprot:CAMPEP_0172440406 /NCGR_PEP_ID=MMETSP1065-20121228/1021_1 /TAXON_ID=265537 /ORGANISM="Amphiprora paludosa, Strain CCMP125" /LENGTH=231 /DNA_ID=CAMNT_0013189205 /DNA_START=143 /DNA_END=838 /DNA_ORIENTATION=+
MAPPPPDRTTMAGMIHNANQVLDAALSPETKAIPRKMFQDVKGIVLLSIVEVGFVLSGNVGTGIILAKTEKGEWGPPCAIGLTGVGWGLLVGGSVKDVMIFLTNETAVQGITHPNGLKLGGQAEVTLGYGRTGALDLNLSHAGSSGTLAVAFTKGVFLGVSVEGAVMGIRHAANNAFYGETRTPNDILAGKVDLPSGDHASLMKDVYEKLEKLSKGVHEEPAPEEKEETKE